MNLTTSGPLPLPETAPDASPDAQVVQAVCKGDTARYRELVERHQRRVYAIAWSRLGDATLAEEATQEAFIRAYRNLPLLGDGAKFPAWVSAIARNLAVSLGLRHRRELNKRARWALEQPATQAAAAVEEPFYTPELLRETLAELPAAHRECLVLYYLEEKSGAEAAAMLGVTETAFRMRLSRARAALREKLEGRLGESLGQLRPSRSLASSIMAVVSTTKMKAGGGLAGAILAAAGKLLPLKFIPFLTPAAAVLPSAGISWWIARTEQRNYRDEKGFRALLHRDFFRSFIWGMMAIILVALVAFMAMMRAFEYNTVLLALGAFCLLMSCVQARLLTICRSRFHVGNFIYASAVGGLIFICGLGWLPITVFIAAAPLLSLFLVWMCRDRPIRMDYNLFLRASQGLIKEGAAFAEPTPKSPAADKDSLLAFARFLGARFLATEFRWRGTSLQLRLPPARLYLLHNFFASFLFWRWQGFSVLTLHADGTVKAALGPQDEATTRELAGAAVPSKAALEHQVADAVKAAWHCFAQNQLAAERALGQLREEDVFKTPPARSVAMRWIMVFMVILAMCSGFISWHLWSLQNDQRLARPLQDEFNREQKDINYLLAEARTRLAQNQQYLTQIHVLDTQLAAATPAEADALRRQKSDLQAQIGQNNAEVNKLNEQVAPILKHTAELQTQIGKILHSPPPPSPPATNGPDSTAKDKPPSPSAT